jgi:20S proteasome alpha/beta subunit
MTLIVSVIFPDGILIAGDSRTTLHNEDGSKEPHDDAQKVFPFCEKFGVATCGRAYIDSKSISSQMRLFELQLNENGTSFGDVTEAAKAIHSHFHQLLIASNYHPSSKDQRLGFHVDGYHDTQPKSVLLDIPIGEKEPELVRTDFNCYYNGDDAAVQVILKELGSPPPSFFHQCSLDEAIDYVDWLFRQTSCRAPSVGGPIDIAVVTPSGGFEWKRKKPSIPD